MGEPGAIGSRSTGAGGPLLGRTRELGILVEALESALSGDGRLVLVSGEAGIGKTRLADTLAGEARQRSAQVLWGRCWEAGGAPAYWPWLQAIRTWLRDADSPTVARALGSGGPHVARILPELREHVPDLSELAPDESEFARFRLFDATAGFLRAIAAERPIVLILDDLHAADEPSLLLLQFLAADMTSSQLLVIAVYREEEFDRSDPRPGLLAALARLPAARRVAPRALTEPEVARYIEDTVGSPPAPGIARAVHGETEGNPLFVGEVVRLLASEGRLDRVDTGIGWSFGITEGVRAVIGRRLARLSQPCHDLLARASVLGVEVPVDVLASLEGRTPDELVELLDEAVAARVMQVPTTPGGRWRFDHALIRDVLYAALPASARIRLHRRTGETLEAMHREDRDPPLAELAHHFVAGAAGSKAAEYARLAAVRATELSAHEEAVRLYRLALEAPGLDEPARCELLVGLGEAATRAGDQAAAKAVFLQAAAIAERLDLSESFARAAVGYGGRFVWIRAGDDDRLVPLLERALAVLGPADGILRARLLARLAGALRDEPHMERRAALSADALAMARRLGDPATLGAALLSRYTSIMGVDGLVEMGSLADEFRQIASRTADRELLADSHLLRVLLAVVRGDGEACRAEVDGIGRLARALRQPSLEWYQAMMRTGFALMEGRLADVEALLPETRHRGDRTQRWDAEFSYRVGLILLRREQGRLEEVADLVRQSADDFPGYRLMSCLRAYESAVNGPVVNARRDLAELSRDGYAYLPRDGGWVFGMLCLAEAALRVGDLARANEIGALLAPTSGQFSTASGDGTWGPVDRVLGLVAAGSGRVDKALALLDRASDQSARMGARLWETRIAVERAGILADRAGPGDDDLARSLVVPALDTSRALGLVAIGAQAVGVLDQLEGPGRHDGGAIRTAAAAESATSRALDTGAGGASREGEAAFRREGDYWAVDFGRTFRLHDAKGLRYLAVLLAQPGREVHVLDLVGPPATPPRTSTSAGEASELGLRVEGSQGAGPGSGLDPEAKAAYRARLLELREEMDEAEGFNDYERAERARVEMEALTAELSAAFGLGGRARVGITSAERARQSVTKAIRDALRRIEAEDVALGAHLARSIRTGLYCVYDPDPAAAVHWRM